MENLTVRVDVEKLLYDVFEMGRRSVAGIANSVEKYRTEPGTEKKNLINHCIAFSRARFAEFAGEFEVASASGFMVDSLSGVVPSLNSRHDSELPAAFVYVFSMTKRRAMHKGQALSDLVHTFFLDQSLSRYFFYVGAYELSLTLGERADMDESKIRKLINGKIPPLISIRPQT